MKTQIRTSKSRPSSSLLTCSATHEMRLWKTTRGLSRSLVTRYKLPCTSQTRMMTLTSSSILNHLENTYSSASPVSFTAWEISTKLRFLITTCLLSWTSSIMLVKIDMSYRWYDYIFMYRKWLRGALEQLEICVMRMAQVSSIWLIRNRVLIWLISLSTEGTRSTTHCGNGLQMYKEIFIF